MADADATANYEFVDGAVVNAVESKELSRRLKDHIYQAIEEREGATLDQAGEIVQAVEARYLGTRVDPLGPVGTVPVQSIGEPGTQMTMNTFHYTGVAGIDVTQGLPRFIELVDARKTPDAPMMTVCFEGEYANNREPARQVVWNIESTRILALGDILVNIADMVVQANLDGETFLERWPTYGDENVVASETVEAIEDALGIKTRREGTLIEFGPKSPSHRRLLQLVEELCDIVFKGTEEASHVVTRKEDSEDTGEEEFVLYTEGSAFGDALAIKGADTSRTTSNNIHGVHKQLGIKAAHEAIIDETINTLREQGLDGVSIRHLILVVDIMADDETIRSISHHGISGSKNSVLAHAAFEVTVNHLLDTAIHGEKDDLNGVIENVIVGKPIAIGTDDTDLRMDSLNVEDADVSAAPESSDN